MEQGVSDEIPFINIGFLPPVNGMITATGVEFPISVEEFWDYLRQIEEDPMVRKMTESVGLYLPEPGEAGFERSFSSGRIYEWGEAA